MHQTVLLTHSPFPDDEREFMGQNGGFFLDIDDLKPHLAGDANIFTPPQM